MKAIAKCTILFLSSLLVSGFIAEAATVTGTVTNKTTGKPSQGDTVVLVDVQAGMAEAARATTDAQGHYSLQSATAGAGVGPRGPPGRLLFHRRAPGRRLRRCHSL